MSSRTPSLGSFVPVCELASGGMGAVSLAIRSEGRFQRLYAVKRMHPHLAKEPELRRMFLDEARIAGLLQHPNTVSVLDYGDDDEGPFMIMDYIEGVDVGDLLREMRRRGTRLPVQLTLRIGVEIARGLHAAHELADHEGQELKVVHRDLSPQNVLISYAGAVRVIDFGIAKAIGRETRTSTGVLKGKMAFMAPEQLLFEDLDRRADLFSLGVVLYEMLSGRRLYGGKDTNRVARMILREPPPDLGEERPELPADLIGLMFDLLAKSPDERPDTASVVATRLEAVLVETLGDEEPLDLGGFVCELFEERRKNERTSIKDKIRNVHSPVAAAPIQALVEADDLPTVSISRRRSFGRWWIAAAVVGVGAVAAFYALQPPNLEGQSAAGAEPMDVAAPPTSLALEAGDPPSEAVEALPESGRLSPTTGVAVAAAPLEVGRAETGPTETEPAEAGAAEAGPAEAGPTETGPTDVATETRPAEVGEAGPAEVASETGPAATPVAVTRPEPRAREPRPRPGMGRGAGQPMNPTTPMMLSKVRMWPPE